MLNFMLGFMSGIYLGTYHNETCLPIMNRLTDCLKNEFNRKLNDFESKDKDSKDKDTKDKDNKD